MDDDLDHLMSPSKYSRNCSADIIVHRHFDIVTNKTKEARNTLKCELGMECQPGGPTIDTYYPNDMSAADSVLIYIHGGYWQAVGLDQCGWPAISLTNNNIILVALGYDLAPKVNMTTIVEQCRKGCAFIANKFPNKKLYILGHSAGGHLAAMMMITDWSKYMCNNTTSYPFKGVVLISGVYDLVPVKKSYVNELLQLTDDEVIHYSPLSEECAAQVSKLSSLGVWFIVAEGEQESPIFKEQRTEYVKLLETNGIVVSQYELQGEDHFTVIEKLMECDYQLSKNIIDHIRSRSPALYLKSRV